MTTEFTLPTPPNFSFRRTIISHGWCELWPFSIDRQTWELRRVIDLGPSPTVSSSMSALQRGVKVTSTRRISKSHLAQVTRDTRHILRLDDDLGAFYSAMTNDQEFVWRAEQGA